MLDTLGLKPVATNQLSAVGKKRAVEEEGEIATILNALNEPRTLDQLAERCTIPVTRLAGFITLLELEGRVRTLPDQRVIAVNRRP